MPAGKLYTIFRKLAFGLKERIHLTHNDDSLEVSKHFAPIIMKVVDFIKN